MLDSFPAASLEDPLGYEPALAAALCQHPREVAEACADLKTGVITECLFRQALTAGRINDWCRRRAEAMHAVIADDNRQWREERDRELARANRESVEELRARLGPTWSLKGIDKLDRVRGETRRDEDEEAAKQRQADETLAAGEQSERAILAEYAQIGMAPIRASDGMAVSRSLVASLVERGLVKRDVLEATTAPARRLGRRRAA